MLCQLFTSYREYSLSVHHNIVDHFLVGPTVLACLLDNLGRAVPYRRLFTVIGRKSDNGYNRHLLRQYMLVLRVMLLANKAPFVIATVNDVGYALCEIAESAPYFENRE